jgi:anti-anti-sigma factor
LVALPPSANCTPPQELGRKLALAPPRAVAVVAEPQRIERHHSRERPLRWPEPVRLALHLGLRARLGRRRLEELAHDGLNPTAARRGQGRAITMLPVSTELSINRRDDHRGVVLTLSGELDVVSAPQLEQCLEEVLAQPNVSVLLDLNGLRFVDSAGVSVLIKAKQDAEASGRTVLLRRPTEQLHRVFALLGLADWLVYED